MDEPKLLRPDTLEDHLNRLADALDDYRATVNRAFTHTAEQIDKLWADNAELRDELHTYVRAAETIPTPFGDVPR